ncbi:HD domain-containing phosphohydrolase [Deinococcus depolymerans]
MTQRPNAQPGRPAALGRSLLTFLTSQPEFMLLTVDAQGRIEAAQGNVAGLLGTAPETLPGQSLADLLVPEDRAALDGLTDQTRRLTGRLRSGGGGRWCELNVLPLDRPGERLVFVRDLSAQRAAEDRTRALEARRQALLDVATDAIVTIDRHGRVVVWNRAAERTFGYSEQDALHQPLVNLIVPPEARAAHLSGMSRHQQTGEGRFSGRRVELQAVRRDGERLLVAVSMTPVLIEGELFYTAFIQDLTQQQAAQRQLREQALHLNLMYEQLPVLSWTTDQDLRVRMVSGGGLARLNLDSAPLVGQRIADLLRGSSHAEQGVSAHMSALAGQRGRYTHPFREHLFEVQVSPLHSESGQTVGTVALATDVTDQRREEIGEQYRARVLRSIATGEPLGDTLHLIADLLAQQASRLQVQLLTVRGGTLQTAPGRPLPPELAGVFSGPVRPEALHPAWVTALHSRDLTVCALNEDGSWTPFRLATARMGVRALWLMPVTSRTGEVIGVIAAYRAAPGGPSVRLAGLLGQAAQLMTVAVEQDQYLQTILTTREETLRTLGVALEFRDYETKGHTDRVVRLSLDLARRLGLSGEQQDELRRGAYLHDLGKIAIPDQILLKPGRPTPDEWELIRRHPVTGYEMLRHTPALGAACLEVVLHHHEHWNGNGYPHGLAGARIPLLARVFAVVDTFDALTSARPYKAAWPEDQALAELEGMAGRVLDPQLVAAFVQLRRAARPGGAPAGPDG